MLWSYLGPSRPTVKEQMMSHSLCELSLIVPTHLAADHNSSHCLASQVLIQQIGHVYRLKGVRDFHLFSRGWSVCTHIWWLIQQSRHCLFTWHKRGDIAYCLSQVGPGGHRPDCCARWIHTLRRASYLTDRFHVGSAGVCDRFNHLDDSVLMNILIISHERQNLLSVVSSPPFFQR